MIRYHTIRSSLSRTAEAGTPEFISLLGRELGEDLVPVSLDDYLRAGFALLFVATGGSEQAFLDIFERLKGKTCYLLTSGESNSLAASMEILSYIRKRGGNGKILHGDVPSVASEIRTLENAHRALDFLRGKNLGCIGSPSDWLIASDYDAEAVKRRLGVGFVQIPMEELLSEISLRSYEDNEYTEALRSAAFDRNETEKALHIYGAAKRLTDRYGLCGVTVRCFDLLDAVRSTGCLALAVLNSLGVYAGCEGDMPALLSMAVLGSLSGQDCFMCNPSRFDTAAGYATFAHCTLPLTMPARYALDTHFESGIGVAVRGTFDPGDCTVFKCAGDLSRHFAAEGRILETPWSGMLCRTQVRVSLPDFSYFLTDPIGNHHILCKGRYARDAAAFFSLTETAL